jgi:hypothetical protein
MVAGIAHVRISLIVGFVFAAALLLVLEYLVPAHLPVEIGAQIRTMVTSFNTTAFRQGIFFLLIVVHFGWLGRPRARPFRIAATLAQRGRILIC